MNDLKRRPSNMNDMCRLCLAEDEITSPIFGEEDSSSESQVPLSHRIMACVSVEVSLSDGFPKVICERCLYHVNTWHEFKQICDSSQATLKEWQNISKESGSFGERDIVIKQEPVDPESEEDVLEVSDDAVSNQIMVEDIKQEVDMYDDDEEEEEEDEEDDDGEEDSVSVEAVEEGDDPLGMAVASNSAAKDVDETEIEIIPQTAGDVCHLRISDIKTECGDVIPIGDVSAEPTEGKLLRSVLQGQTKLTMYSKTVPAALDEIIPSLSVKPFLCRLCDKSFAYNYLLKRHEKTHAGDRNVCGFCQKGFSSHASLVQHVQYFNGTTPMPYSCTHCLQEFSCRTRYLLHVDGSDGSHCGIVAASRENSEDNGDCQLDQSAQCEECFEKFPSLMLLRLHMRKEHLHYSCHKCGKSYTNGVALSNHLRSHSIGSGLRHHCDSCTRSFPTYELLKRHERTHMKENAAMTIIPSEIVSKSSECDSQDDTNMAIPEIEIFLDRPIKEEPPDSPEVAQDVEESCLEKATSHQLHVCHLCKEEFPTIASLRFHLKGVHLHYQCHRCPKVYSSGVALSNHLRSHSLSNFKKHKCLVCLKSFSTIDLLSKHKKIHTAPAALETPTSAPSSPRKRNTSLPGNEELENDLTIAAFDDDPEVGSVDEPLVKRTCTVCNFVAASPSALERHMACHTKEKMFTCSICQVSMSYASSLQKHYRLIHNKHVELRTIQKNAVMEESGSENLTTTEAQSNVEESSERYGVSRFGRKLIFNKTFKMTAQIKRAHLPTPYECKVCHRSFAYRSFLLKHSKVHCTPDAKVMCQVCRKTFPDAKTLNNHKGVHTRFKLYSCTICGKSFNGLNAWEKHERMHQKGFIYSCKLCGKKFLSKAELHEHKKMHIKVKIYTCAVCKNSYHSSSALGKHKRRHGHYYASPENSDMSEVEVVNNLPALETSGVRNSISKSVIQQSIPKSLTVRPVVTKAKSLTHFPSGKRKPFCNICHKTFSHLSAMRRHKRQKHLKTSVAQEQKPVIPLKIDEAEENVCVLCNRTFPDHVSLVRHKGWHTRRSNITSPEPGTVPNNGKIAVNTSIVKVEPTINAYQCSLCSKTFTTSAALENHVKSHSEAITKAIVGENSKIISDKVEVLNSQRRLACKICKKPFESKKALITHIGWHSRDTHANKTSFNSYKPKGTPKLSVIDRFSCNVCHKIFSSAVILSKHKKLHTRKLLSSIKDKSGEVSEPGEDDANFFCQVCQRTFKLEKYLKLHMRLHTGEKRFKCSLCPQAYHRSGSLWKHKRTHHNMRVYPCPTCQKCFGLKSQLTKHMDTHQLDLDFSHTDTVFACSMCERTFPTLSKFKQHERTHHN